jgi:hypothetical protein
MTLAFSVVPAESVHKLYFDFSKKEFKSNMKESYPDHNGGKYHKMADSMQDMADKAKNDGDHRRAATYQKFADQHRAEATEWEEKNKVSEDAKKANDRRNKIATKLSVKRSEEASKKPDGYDDEDVDDDSKSLADRYQEVSKDYEDDDLTHTDIVRSMKETHGATRKEIEAAIEKHGVSKHGSKKVKKSIDETDIKKAFDKLGSF